MTRHDEDIAMGDDEWEVFWPVIGDGADCAECPGGVTCCKGDT